MIDVLNRYKGRKLRDKMIELFEDEIQELDTHFLLEQQISASITALIYFTKDDHIIDSVKSVKTTPNGRWNIMNVMSDAMVKTLDKRIDSLCEV